MIPYTLTKRPPPAAAKRKKRPAKAANVGGDSDSDGEPVSFFSHLESTTVQSHKQKYTAVPISGCNIVKGESPLDAAPLAPKPFTAEEEGGGVWEEGFLYPVAGDLDGSAAGEEVVDQRFEQPAMEGVGSKAGPVLNMDDQAVSD